MPEQPEAPDRQAPAARPPAPAALTEAQRRRALARFRLLRPFLEDGVPLGRIAREQGVTLRTAQRWVAGYRRDGLAGLVRRVRADRGGHRLSTPLQQLIEGLALQTPRRISAAIHRQVAAVAARQGWRAPGYKLVRAVVREMDPALPTLAHAGAKGYAQAFELLHRREAERANAIWQPARAWLTIVLDDFSRAVAGYYLTFAAPSALGAIRGSPARLETSSATASLRVERRLPRCAQGAGS